MSNKKNSAVAPPETLEDALLVIAEFQAANEKLAVEAKASAETVKSLEQILSELNAHISELEAKVRKGGKPEITVEIDGVLYQVVRGVRFERVSYKPEQLAKLPEIAKQILALPGQDMLVKMGGK